MLSQLPSCELTKTPGECRLRDLLGGGGGRHLAFSLDSQQPQLWYVPDSMGIARNKEVKLSYSMTKKLVMFIETVSHYGMTPPNLESLPRL
jgi:hypothetical protein